MAVSGTSVCPLWCWNLSFIVYDLEAHSSQGACPGVGCIWDGSIYNWQLIYAIGWGNRKYQEREVEPRLREQTER
jgi:hypothetical protein